MNKKAELNDLGAGIIIAIIIVAVILYPHYQEIVNFQTYLSKLNFSFYLIALFCLMVIIIVSYIFVISVKKVYSEITSLKDEARCEKMEVNETENLLDSNLPTDEQTLQRETEMLRNKIKEFRQTKNAHFIPKLRERLAKAKERLEAIRKKGFLDEEINQKSYKIEKLDEEIRMKEQYEQNKHKYILWKLKAEDNPVFFKEKLTEEQIKALIKGGYRSVCEYDIIQKQFVNVLVKPKLNHSPTHAFLVWNVIKLLEKIDGIKNIREFLTKEADIIFDFNGKSYALEIEKSNLLWKEKQLKEKVNYLNKKYSNRWMFIVSNRNFLAKYRKFGLATPRKGVSEKLSKMLEITHPI